MTQSRTRGGLTPPRVLGLLLPPVLLLISLPSVWRGGAAVPLALVLTLALVGPLLARERHPVAVFATISAVALLQWTLDVRLVADVALLAALYAVAVRQPRRVALGAALVVEAGVGLAVARWQADRNWLTSCVLLSGMVVAAVVLGFYTSTRRAYLDELQTRADRLELERDQQGQLAAAAERARIAREMHDIVAHHLTVMIALSDGAAAAVAGSPERAKEAMTSVSATGRQALAETRSLLGVLRSDAPAGSRSPQPVLDELDSLVEQVRAAGLPVTFTVDGAPGTVAPGVELTIYRLVQEALTNTLKHGGPGAQADVRLAHDAAGVRLEIVDDGLGGGAGHADAPVAGHGLAGMRERVEAWGGGLVSGPRPGGGWRVVAHLARHPALAAEQPPADAPVR